MRKLDIPALLLPLLLCATSDCQQAPPTAAQYTTTLRTVITNESGWRKTIRLVSIEDLPVDYAVGKRFEANQNLVDDDLRVTVAWAARTQKEHSLFAEVNFLSSIQQLESEIYLFVGLLGQFEVRGAAAQKRVSDWTVALSELANGSVNEAWKTSFLYTTNRALLIDQSCPGSVLLGKP